MLAFVVLGSLFNVTGTLWNIAVAWAAARIVSARDVIQWARIWLQRLLGAMFIGIGVRLALAERP